MIICILAAELVAQDAAKPILTTAPAEDGNSVIIRWPELKPDSKQTAPAKFPARFTAESLTAFVRNNPERLPLPMKSDSEQEAIIDAVQRIDMGMLLQQLRERLTMLLDKRIDWSSGLIVRPIAPEHQVTIELSDIGMEPYQGPRQAVAGLIVNEVTEDEFVVIALSMMEKARQLILSGDPVFDREHPDHLQELAEREVADIRANHQRSMALAREKEEVRKRVGQVLGVYDPKTGEFGGEPKWLKESRRFCYVVNPQTGQFIDRLRPLVEQINCELALAGFPGPTPLDKPGIHFDPNLGDVEVVLPRQMLKTFLDETDALEQRMAEKLTISIEAVRLTDRDIVNGAIAARLGADMLGVHDADYGYDQRSVLRRLGINALTAVANQQLQIQQLNSVANGVWPAATPLVTLDPPQLPPLRTSKTWTAVGGDWSVGADPIFFDGRQQTFGLTYYDPNGVQHTLGLDVVDSLRKYWSRIERNLIVHKIKKDPSIPVTKFTVPVGPNDNTFEGLAALISQEDQNLIVATGTGAISQISAKAGTWLVIQDFQIAPLPGSSTAMTEEEIEELQTRTMLTMLLRDPNTPVEMKQRFLCSENMQALEGLLEQRLAAVQNQEFLTALGARTYGQIFAQRFADAIECAAIKKKEENSVIALTFYSSQGNIIQSPGATQLGSANDLTALTTELRPNAVTPISSFVLKSFESTDSRSPLTGLNKGESSDESKTMSHLLVRARFPTSERERRDVEEGRQLGYFKLPLGREPLSTNSLPFLSSSDHPLERLASFRIGAMFDSLQASKIRRPFSLSEPNIVGGTISQGTWETAMARMMLNLKIIDDSPNNHTSMAPVCRRKFIVEVRSLLEFDSDFFNEPNVALRTMDEWNDVDNIVAALNNSPGRFALGRLIKMIDEVGLELVPDDYVEGHLARADYSFLAGHRLKPLNDEEVLLVRRDVANHFFRRAEAYGDAFMEAVSAILKLGSYRAMSGSELRKGPLRGYQDLVVLERNSPAEQFMSLKNGGYKGALFEPSLTTIEDLPAEQRKCVIVGDKMFR